MDIEPLKDGMGTCLIGTFQQMQLPKNFGRPPLTGCPCRSLRMTKTKKDPVAYRRDLLLYDLELSLLSAERVCEYLIDAGVSFKRPILDALHHLNRIKLHIDSMTPKEIKEMEIKYKKQCEKSLEKSNSKLIDPVVSKGNEPTP